jgi:gas vesicle structural protein
MAVQSSLGGSSLVDVLDRVLDKGIVIDVWARVSLVGIEILGIEARVVVASVETYLKYAHAIGMTANVARPRLEADTVVETPLIEPPRRIPLLEARPNRAKASAPRPRRRNSVTLEA